MKCSNFDFKTGTLMKKGAKNSNEDSSTSEASSSEDESEDEKAGSFQFGPNHKRSGELICKDIKR
jgi:hypothetical protein